MTFDVMVVSPRYSLSNVPAADPSFSASSGRETDASP